MDKEYNYHFSIEVIFFVVILQIYVHKIMDNALVQSLKTNTTFSILAQVKY